MNLAGKTVKLHDMCLRDGMHAKRHLISVDQMISVASALDDAGIHLVEVTHGDGLGGASINYGFPASSDEDYLQAVVPRMKNAKVSALLLPGIGTVDHLNMAGIAGFTPSAWPPIAPRRTCPNSTSVRPGKWVWIRSAS